MSKNNYTNEELAMFEFAGVNPDEEESANAEDNNDIIADNLPASTEDPNDINTDPLSADEGNPVSTADKGADNNAQPQNNEPATEQTTPLILGKFKSVDELKNAYTNLEAMSGRQASQISELNRKIAEGLPQNGQTAVPQVKKEITQDMFSGINDEDLQQMLFSNPRGVLTALMEDVSQKAKEDAKLETTANDYVNKFFAENPDMMTHIDEFKALTAEIGNPDYALEIIRGRKAGNLNDLLKNEQFVSDNMKNGNFKSVLSDEGIFSQLGDNVKQKVIDEYLKGIESSKSKATVMNSNSGSISKLPPKTYENVFDAFDDNVAFLKELEKEERK